MCLYVCNGIIIMIIFETTAEYLTPTSYRNQFDVNGEGKNVRMEETKWIHNLRTDVFKKLSVYGQSNLPRQVNFNFNTVKKKTK